MTAEDCVLGLEQQRRYLTFLLQVKEGKLSGIPYGPETDEEIQGCVQLTARLLARLVYLGKHLESDMGRSDLPF